ncbi:MAG: hypothetical protein COA91_04020 [Robiginitomaculum sp.]|nr:MAG: hypothetical protein COA91_04020 [Robiginitomaculum sp.]
MNQHIFMSIDEVQLSATRWLWTIIMKGLTLP